jgi:microcystin-dependent protein
MSQHDFNIANQSFPATRTDLNNALVALASNSSGDAEPATKYANQWWYETDTNTLKLRNEANDAWISIAVLDQSGNAVQSITTAGLTLGSTAISATGAEINQLDAITRGSILYGNASGATARLAAGGASTVLTSDGTDISWAAAGGGVPAGSIIYHAANTAPTGFIKANGAAVSRSTYSDLFTAIGTTFGVGDGSSTFNVPDLRGEFLRGWDDSRGIDTGRIFGSAQADELKSHNHSINVRYSATFNGGHVSANSLGGNSQNLGSSIASTGGSETRPRNIALLACIKY